MKIVLLKRGINKYFIFLLLGLILLLSGADYFYYNQRLYPGIYIKEINLGNKTLSEAENTVKNLQMTFWGPGEEKESLTLKNLGVEILNDEMIHQCYQMGRQRIWPFNYLDRLSLKKGSYISLPYKINDNQLYESVDNLINTFNRAPADAGFEIVKETAQLNPEKFGFQVQKENLVQEILKNLEQEETPLQITVPGTEITPDFTVSHFVEKGITQQMASFTTAFDASYEERVHNIELAASIINKHLIAPGDIFSFNQIVGDTTPDKGYKEALIIQGGEFTTGYGGGVCQVSSTLYNAALLSNMQILERHNHRFMAAYVSAGRDAAVSYGTYDLMFRNNRDHHILINTRVENGEITIAIVGGGLEEEVEIETNYLNYIEPSLRIEVTSQLAPGEEEKLKGKPGGTIKVWRIIQRPDGEKSEEILSVDTYLPYPAILRKGKAD
ncbi:VanW family protein [Candidatus Contubernalis alkaliaceticus]|uniref:VanW family protein n=1 Tax=Candidatus Contubernalis alkaliaceticus TaxID=338645 RepID=UPI001F4BFB59|nr:VanW family protein [Candidatus Contubernalis alkalaceticus]UNC93297.1 VanW family protein [Candidatus Contubernalis alkalaceticus]